MTKNLAIVLPMYNEQNGLPNAFAQLRQVVDKIYPEFLSRLFVFVDGATDGTAQAAHSLVRNHQLPTNYHYQPDNMGLGLTTRLAFDAALDCKNDYILKTDVDGDFDIGEVVLKLTEKSKGGADAVIGVRSFIDMGDYESRRRQYILGILEQEFGIGAKVLDPAQLGSYMFKAEAVETIMQEDTIRYFAGRWGLDFLTALVAYSKGMKIETVILPNKKVNIRRRGISKVREQYDSYLPIIAAVKFGFPTEVKNLLAV